MRKHLTISIITYLFCSFCISGQEIPTVSDTTAAAANDSTAYVSAAEISSMTAMADSLQKSYCFAEAATIYKKAAKSTADSVLQTTLKDRLISAENGMNMMKFCSKPAVVARHMFSIEDFFLFYPLEDRSWRKVPNKLDSLGTHPFAKATYFPENAETVYFSAPDADGVMNICRTEFKDSLWSLPSLINESLTSYSDEIFPMLSPDGKSLYFASSGLYGVGGYDLYVSEWDEETGDWGVPVNMGFPYSSPYNDFLYMNTSDGKYTLFASDRGCPKDSVYLYVLEFENMPVRSALDNTDALKKLMELTPVDDPARMDNGSTVSGTITDSVDITRYTKKVSEVRSLRDSISNNNHALDRARNRFAESDNADERDMLTSEILQRESLIPGLQDSLVKVTAQLQQIEMEFLFSGVVIDPDKMMQEADKEVVGAASSYTFTKMSFGSPLDITVEKPVKKFDYSFMILPEGRFAENNELPEGIIYQIQIFSLLRKATVKDIKGLSPVFEHHSAPSKYIYRVGLFTTYKDVLANLNKVKRAGFRNAFITAFQDGKPITVQKARTLEKTKKDVYNIVIYHDAESLPELAVTAINQESRKDIAKSSSGGTVSFIVGLYDDLEEAERTCAALRALGLANISVVKAGEIEMANK